MKIGGRNRVQLVNTVTCKMVIKLVGEMFVCDQILSYFFNVFVHMYFYCLGSLHTCCVSLHLPCLYL